MALCCCCCQGCRAAVEWYCCPPPPGPNDWREEAKRLGADEQSPGSIVDKKAGFNMSGAAMSAIRATPFVVNSMYI